jgi:signal recognition particle GTPase
MREYLMSFKKYYYLAPLLCLLSLNVNAEYKTSGDMTQEEYQKVREASAEHSACMNEYAQSQLQKQSDPRVITDHAMKECSHILEELYNFLLTGNYAPEAMRRFVSSISNKAANKMLPKLMMYMAAQGQ